MYLKKFNEYRAYLTSNPDVDLSEKDVIRLKIDAINKYIKKLELTGDNINLINRMKDQKRKLENL